MDFFFLSDISYIHEKNHNKSIELNDSILQTGT